MNVRGIQVAVLLVGILATGAAMQAADPPELIGFQGVLRDSAEQPIDGSYDIVFALFDSGTAGNEILLDSHTGGGAVLVTGGMFNVPIGSGVISDGTGPGTYTSLAAVFRDHGAVWLEVRVGGETLSPRTRVSAAAYAMNASALGGRAAGEFLDTSASPQSKAGRLVLSGGVDASSNDYGGYFHDSDDTGVAYLGYGNYGVEGFGTASGGYFQDSDNSGYALIGTGDQGISAYGNSAGGYFADLNSTGYCYVGYGDYGVSAHGQLAGGFFRDTNQSGYAYVGYGDQGIEGYGTASGGYFRDSDGTGEARLGWGDTGVYGRGSFQGGQFSDASGGSLTRIADGISGVNAEGTSQGGVFRDSDDSGFGYVGYGDTGIYGSGSSVGGIFVDSDGSGMAHVAYNQRGIMAEGDEMGGSFHNSASSGYAYLAYGNTGVNGYGEGAGGYFNDLNNSSYAYVGYSTYKIYGTGSVNFVQNHPERDDRVIVYTAPEGDEVAVYTRGTARLVDGEARVPLGETFRWVANPDLGLTAHLTPRLAAVPLAVSSLTTRELVVRGPADIDVAFDYLVYGLRVGFEETSPVQEKVQEAYIPSMAPHRERYEKYPDLRQFNALSRFEAMDRSVQGAAPSRDGARALVAAIGEYDPAVHGPAGSRESEGPGVPEQNLVPAAADGSDEHPDVSAPSSTGSELAARLEGTATQDLVADLRVDPLFPVSEEVAPGDVVAFDPVHPGTLRRADSPGDPGIVGIVAEFSESTTTEGKVPLVGTHYGYVHADATYGAIRPGDLLTSSPTPGHAMTNAAPVQGTVLGKALEPLESGTGRILVLIMPR